MSYLKSTTSKGDCRVAILTPAGRGAIATVGVRGSQAASLVAEFFTRSQKRLAELPIGQILFGHWRHSSATGVAEEVVVVRTRDDRVDVHCHGGNAAAVSILKALVASGAEPCVPVDWLSDEHPDPLKGDALTYLTKAETERVAGILLDQYWGALGNELKAIDDELRQDRFAAATCRLEELNRASRLGVRLTLPWRVVVTGPPNAGKSSLLNALLGYGRSIVYDQPGTTRDRVEAQTALDGWPFVLFDTAGLRTAEDHVEAAGISLAYEAVQNADLVLWVSDVTRSDEGLQMPADLATRETVLVANKIDLLASASCPEGVPTSALTGEGIEELKRVIVDRLVPNPPLPGAPVPFTYDQCSAIQAMLEALKKNDLDGALQVLKKSL
jgi:tRNA modification GTPase